MAGVRGITKWLFDLIYPPRCLLCGGESVDKLCATCWPDAGSEIVNQVNCHRCGEDASEAHHGYPNNPLPLCVACEVWPPPIRYLRSLYRYGDRIEDLIKAYKYRPCPALGKFFGELLAAQIVTGPQPLFSNPEWDLIIPIPSTRSSLVKRGFAHTSVLAREIGKNLSLSYSNRALISVKSHASQASKNYTERFANIAGSFRARPELVREKRILLVDDVVTSGATLFTASCALLDAGARSVDGITVARSHQFHALRLAPTEHARQLRQNAVP